MDPITRIETMIKMFEEIKQEAEKFNKYIPTIGFDYPIPCESIIIIERIAKNIYKLAFEVEETDTIFKNWINIHVLHYPYFHNHAHKVMYSGVRDISTIHTWYNSWYLCTVKPKQEYVESPYYMPRYIQASVMVQACNKMLKKLEPLMLKVSDNINIPIINIYRDADDPHIQSKEVFITYILKNHIDSKLKDNRIKELEEKNTNLINKTDALLEEKNTNLINKIDALFEDNQELKLQLDELKAKRLN